MKFLFKFIVSVILSIVCLSTVTQCSSELPMINIFDKDTSETSTETTVDPSYESVLTCYTINFSPTVANMVYDFNFVSNGIEYWYLEMDADAGTIVYGVEHGVSTVVAYSNGTWISEEYRKIYVNPKLMLPQELLAWFGSNSEADHLMACEHTESISSAVLKDPKCVTVGINQESCSVCGFSKLVSVPALGHTLDSDGYCERCGETFEVEPGEYTISGRYTFGNAGDDTVTWTSQYVQGIVYSSSDDTEGQNFDQMLYESYDTYLEWKLAGTMLMYVPLAIESYVNGYIVDFGTDPQTVSEEFYTWVTTYATWSESQVELFPANTIAAGTYQINDNVSEANGESGYVLEYCFGDRETVTASSYNTPVYSVSVNDTSVDNPEVYIYISDTDTEGICIYSPGDYEEGYSLWTFNKDVQVSVEFFTWFMANFTIVQ